MNISVIRAIVQYNDERMGILFERSSSQREFIEKCLEEFELLNEDWNMFEIINVEHQCKLRTSSHIRKEDELLLLKKKISFFKGREFEDESQEELILMPRENILTNFATKSRISMTPEKIGTIVMVKEELDYFNNSMDEQKGDQELKSIVRRSSQVISQGELEEDLKAQQAPKDSTSQEGTPNKQENKKEEVIIEVSEIISKEYADRSDLKSQVIQVWGAKEKMKLSFKTRETTLIKDNSKVSTIFCAKNHELNCPFFLEFRAISKTAPYKLASYWDTHNHILSKYDNTYAITEEILEKIKVIKNTVKSISELTETINNLFKKKLSSRYYQQFSKQTKKRRNRNY